MEAETVHAPNQVTAASVSGNRNTSGTRAVNLLVRCGVYLAILTIPCVLVFHFRFIPFDDGLHHAAKAISGKPWNDILVLRDDIRLDPNPGWHALLSAFHRWSGAGPEALVIFSYSSLLLLATLVTVPLFPRPEAWIAAMTIAGVALPDTFFFRLTRGRPYLLTEAVLLVLLFTWRKAPRKPSPLLLLLTVTLTALSSWIHGAWYLWIIVPAAFCVLGEFAATAWFTACWLVGSFLGAALTGHPVGYLQQQALHLCQTFGHGSLPRLLVGELHPTDGCAAYLLALAGVYMFRRSVMGGRIIDTDERLLLATGLLGWIGGLLVSRWWSEWGVPATLLWMALALQNILEKEDLLTGLRRLVFVALSCAALVFAFVGNRGERWTGMVWAAKGDPRGGQSSAAPASGVADKASWLPDPDGLAYNSQMSVFTRLFFENPYGAWRYVYGFESGLMTPENLRVLRDIQFAHGAWSAYRPWVTRMTTADRLIVMAAARPEIVELDWREIDEGLWSGRLPLRSRE